MSPMSARALYRARHAIGMVFLVVGPLMVFAPQLASHDQEIRETAALSIGIAALPSAANLDLLVALATDTAARLRHPDGPDRRPAGPPQRTGRRRRRRPRGHPHAV